MKTINRKETLEIILNEFGDLKISPEYYYKDYPRTISTTWETDRHIQCGHFSDMTKSKDKFISSNILFFEIDDLDLKKDPKNWPNYIDKHLNLIRNAIKEFLGKELKITPIIGTFSGSKSIHFLFKLDKQVPKEEYFLIKEGFDYISTLVLRDMKLKTDEQYPQYKNTKLIHGEMIKLNLKDLKYPSLSQLDLNIPFNSSASPRIHCDVPQNNRLSQKSIYFEDFTTINSQILVDRSKIYLKLKELEKKQFIEKRENDKYLSGNYYSKERLENILQKDLTPTSKLDKFLLTCPVHEDNNKSAFVTKSGFLYCSVCCIGGLKYAGKIVSGRLITNPELKHSIEGE